MRAAGEQLDIIGQINVWILARWTLCSLPLREQDWTALITLQLQSRKHDRRSMHTKQPRWSLLYFIKLQPLQGEWQTQAEVRCGQKNKWKKGGGKKALSRQVGTLAEQLAMKCWNNSTAARAILHPNSFTPQPPTPSNSEPCVFFVSSFILCQCPRCEKPSSEKLVPNVAG